MTERRGATDHADEKVSPERITSLIVDIGAGAHVPTVSDIATLRRYFARRVLPSQPTRRVLDKHDLHAITDQQWRDDTSAEEYLDSLRTVVEDSSSSLYLARDPAEETWALYFVGRVRRQWRGRYAGSRVVVLFNGERHFWITGFQAERGDSYVARQGGFWVYRP